MRPLLLLAAIIVLAAREAEPVLPKPSGNAGKSGTYQVETGSPGYSYFVRVPAQGLPDAHWGLHLFFHGQNGQGGAKDFGLWQDTLDADGLIGINMCYADGDNLKDTAGKVAAARAAVLQVMADYPVVPGRGMVACFSGGGLPCGLWYSESGRTRGLAWPFLAQALYSSNFRVGVQPQPETGWYVGVNTDEWTLAELGQTQTARFAEALGGMAKSGPDMRLLVMNHLGHTIPREGVTEAKDLFRRLDLAYAPFLHPGAYPVKLARIVATANAGQLAAAVTALGRLKEDPATAVPLADLHTRIEARVAAQLAMVADLAKRDPLLANWYGVRFSRGLKGHPREAELRTILAELAKAKSVAPAAAAAEAFAKGFSRIFAGGPVISQQALPLLEQTVKAAGAESLYGRMAAELLALPHAAPGK